MIIVVCNSYQDACDAFDIFSSFCERYEPFMLVETDKYSLRCVADDDLIYIFIDYRFKDALNVSKADVIEVDEFFEDLYSHYDADIFEDFHYGWISW